jgi:hypothetical protein
MSTITLRATKGSPLTNTEVDNNFSNLNTDKLESTYSGAMNSLTGGTSIATVGTITAGTWNGTVISGQFGGTGVNNSGKTITLGGNLTTSGAYATTLTATGTTNVTLPTTGTLATLAGSEALTNKSINGLTVTSTTSGTLTIANSSTLATSGAFGITLTSTATTNVTLPTTGTLATIAGTETLTNKTLTSPVMTAPTLGVATGTSLALSSLTSGRVPFAGASGLLSDSTGLLFDATNKTIVVGGGNALGGTTNPIAAFTKNDDNYIQSYVFNASTGTNASADLVAYPDNGADTSGWIDMGITSSLFSSATYSVTGENEGYIFMSSPAGAGKSGNLVIATDSTGTANAIQFYTNGFNGTKSAPKMALLSSGALAFGSMTAYGTSGQLLQSNGNGAPTWVTPAYASTGKAIAMAMVFGG